MKKILFMVLFGLSTAANAEFVCQGTSIEGTVFTGRWFVGQSAFKFTDSAGNVGFPDEFFWCAAWDTELNSIRSKFTGIKMRNSGSGAVMWKGEDALFLVDNIASH